MHGGRTARNHLLCLAQTNAIPISRVDEVLGLVGLSDVASKRTADSVEYHAGPTASRQPSQAGMEN